jgi:predicted ATPase
MLSMTAVTHQSVNALVNVVVVDAFSPVTRMSLVIARDQQAKSWELRAALSLSRLWQQQDRMADAHHLLKGVYETFTEGFDTADLIEDRGLLEQLQL